MEKLVGILGILSILGIAYLLSNNKNKIDKKLIIWGISLQIFFAKNPCDRIYWANHKECPPKEVRPSPV